MNFRDIFVVFLFVFWVSGCAFKKGAPEASGLRTETARIGKVEAPARSLFNQAEKQFQNKDYDRALRTYQSIRSKFSGGRAAQVSSYRIASIYYYREQYQEAGKEFEIFLAKYPTSDLAFDATYNLSASEFQRGNFSKARESINRLKASDIQTQGPRRGEVVYQLKSQIAAAAGDHVGAAAALAAKLLLPLTENDRAGTEEAFDAEIARMVSVADLQKLSNEVTEPASKNKIQARMAALTAFPTTTTVTEATVPPPVEYTDSTGDRWAVGVVLPLSGKYAPYGRKALDGILLAAQSYAGGQVSDVQLHIADSRSSPTVAAAAIENLISEHHVMAVIGPLSYRESVSVGQRAQGSGVVNLSLSAKEGISERGGFLFQNALTPKVQLESLVEYAVGTRGYKRFAILSPESLFGKDMSGEFINLVEQAGGKVVGYGSYPMETTDFQSVVQELVGLNPKYRRMELAKLAEWAKEQKAKTGREPKTRLLPIVDFDAIFIPDNPKTVATIAASLAYFDVSKATLLGTTEWNNEVLYKRGGRYVEGAIFPGAFRADSDNPFAKTYLAAYGFSADTLSGQAYEAMSIVRRALFVSNSSSRESLAREMVNLKEFESPLGKLGFDANRMARRKLPIYTVAANGKVSQVK